MQSGLLKKLAFWLLIVTIAFFVSSQTCIASEINTALIATVINNGLFSNTAQTLNAAGAAQTSFASGATMKIDFVLGSLGGNGSIVWAITVQHDNAVYNIVNVPCSINTVGTIIIYSQLIPVYYPIGTWTAIIQVYASDGVTPLAVTNLTFIVA